MSTNVCKNCNVIISGRFCSNSGQPANVHRIDAGYFLHDIPHSILHVDKGFPYTFMQLIKRPAKALQEYIDGKRVQFFRPMAYVVLISAICSVLISWIRKYIRQIHFSRTGEALSEHPSFFSHYQSVFIFLMIPVVSAITYLMFKKSRYNFWEHVLINTYLAAQLNVLLLLIQLFLLINLLMTGSLSFSLIIFMTGFMTYYALTFSGLMYKEVTGWKLGLRLGIMCFLLASVYATAISFSGLLQ